MQKGNQQQDGWTMGQTFNLTYAVLNGHATGVSVFLRSNFGTEALGIPGLIALALIVLVGGFNGSPEMFIYLFVWLFYLARQRMITAKLVRNKVILHSMYQGDPDLALRFTSSRSTAINFVEPVICLVAGGGLATVSPVLGAFVGMGAVSLSARNAINQMIDQKRLQAMTDAHIDQQILADRFRERMGGS